MKQVRFWGVSMLLVLLLGIVPVAVGQGGNLLNNPGFEGFYRSYNYGNTIDQLVLEFRVADGWTPWFRPQAAGDPGWRYRRPEYRPASYSYNGSAAQQFFTSFGTHQAGLFQRVTNATPGQTYRFSIAAYIWSSNEENVLQSTVPGDARVRVGIDPNGGTNPYASSVVWSPFATFYDSWRVLAVDAVAGSRSLTVFVWSEQTFPVVHNDVALDEAYLGLASGAPVPGASDGESEPGVEEAVPQPAVPIAPASPTGITLTADTNLRMRATIYGSTLGVIPAGTPVLALGRSPDRNWTLVEYNGQQGWVASWIGVYSASFDTLPEIAP